MKIKKILLIVLILLILFALGLGTYSIINTIQMSRTSIIQLKDNQEGKEISISITKGEKYAHDLQINALITIKTQPQYAIWIEDLNGNYLQTLYATSKIIRKKWSKAPSDPTVGEIKREEALPYWTHKKNFHQSVVAAISSATPKGSSLIKTKISQHTGKYLILAEFNNSTDFNEYYPKEAKPGDINYSGGEWGSGQPALIYAATINLNETDKSYELKPIGHSSPDGKDGQLYEDLSKITTAQKIINSLIVEIQ